MGIYDADGGIFTVNDLCKVLSISVATAKNWIRLGKIAPDIDGQCFSKSYVDRLVMDISSGENSVLKSRRNKRSRSGRVLYRDYIQTVSNQQLVENLLELDIIVSEADLSAILANFAVQLYYQQKEIDFKDNYVLAEFLQGCKEDDFYPLITELLGAKFIACDTAHRLSPALCQRVQLVNGEDTLGFVYISLRDIAQRKSTGMYYTKAVVVDQ